MVVSCELHVPGVRSVVQVLLATSLRLERRKFNQEITESVGLFVYHSLGAGAMVYALRRSLRLHADTPMTGDSNPTCLRLGIIMFSGLVDRYEYG